MFKKLLITTLLFSSTASFCSGIVNNNVSSFANNNYSIVDSVARKYQSNNVDIASISFQNILADIVKSGFINEVVSNIKSEFEIYRTNESKYHWIYLDYTNSDSGNAAAKTHAQKLRLNLATSFSYAMVLTIIAKVAHYYGEHTEMNFFIRQAAISKIIYTLVEFKNHFKNVPLINSKEFNTNWSIKRPYFLSFINNFSSNIPQIINNVINKKYNNDLFTKCYNWNFNNIYRSASFAFWDIECQNLWWDTPKSSYVPYVGESTHLGPFKVHLVSRFRIERSKEIFYSNTYFYLKEPIFDFEV